MMCSKAQFILFVSTLAGAVTVLNASAQVSLVVYQSGKSNIVFRIKNNTTNSIRLPADGYVPLNRANPVSTNPPSQLVGRSVIEVGLWLTRDWRQMGTNWMLASNQEWRKRLKIKTLKPGDTLGITRSLEPWSDLIQTNTNAVACFQFSISPEFAKQFDLWQGSLCVTGLTEVIPPSLGSRAVDIQQMLDVYAKLTGAKLDVQEDVRQIHMYISVENNRAMTKPEAIAYLEKALYDQAGIVAKHVDAKHIRITLNQPAAPH